MPRRATPKKVVRASRTSRPRVNDAVLSAGNLIHQLNGFILDLSRQARRHAYRQWHPLNIV